MEKNRGFTLAEAMVTMALVIISALFAVSVSMYCTACTERTYVQFQASNLSADVLNCFILARSQTDELSRQQSEFTKYLYYYNDHSDMTIQTDEYMTADYSFNHLSLRARVQAQFSTGIIYVFAYTGNAEKPIYSFGYNTKLNMQLEV